MPRATPFLLTTEAGNANAAALRMYVEGAEVDIEPGSEAYEPRDPAVRWRQSTKSCRTQRRRWSRLKGQGFALAYWQQGDDGRWTRQM